jgi:formylglycine-generating enzyme required for sulfatase activity
MHGNVWEWCLDAAEVQGGSDQTDTYVDGVVDPLCQTGRNRVYRGGSWRATAGFAVRRTATRTARAVRYDYLGFRVCLARSPAEGQSSTGT